MPARAESRSGGVEALGDPAIARAFKLDKLYRSRGGSAESGEEDEGSEEAPEGEAAAPKATDTPETTDASGGTSKPGEA